MLITKEVEIKVNDFNIDFNDPNYPCIDHKIGIRNGYLDGISEEVFVFD